MGIPPGSFSNRQDVDAHSEYILQTTFSIAIMVATLFVGFSPTMVYYNPKLLISRWQTSQQKNGPILQAIQGQDKPIGIVSGQWDNGNDSCAICLDGTKEQVLNLTIATLVRQKLEVRCYRVDMLQEFDSRLEGHDGEVLIAMHTDSCNDINNQVTGFKVAASTYSQDTNLAYLLTACLDSHYAKVTGLRFNPVGITENMTNNHAFRAVNPATTAAIIETGFLHKDRDILVTHPSVVADGIVSGLVCFVANESVQTLPMPTP